MRFGSPCPSATIISGADLFSHGQILEGREALCRSEKHRSHRSTGLSCFGKLLCVVRAERKGSSGVSFRAVGPSERQYGQGAVGGSAIGSKPRRGGRTHQPGNSACEPH